MQTAVIDRRKTARHEADEILRWKRPGRVEDHKAWNTDLSMDGIGFLTLPNTDPQVGEVIHLRMFNRDRWATFERVVRIARVQTAPGGDLLMVGCSVESGLPLVEQAGPSAEAESPGST